MKVLKSDFLDYSTGQRDMYDFDQLSNLDDIKEIINMMIQKEFEINKIVVREFDDYENAPLIMRYNLPNIDDIVKDFEGKTIETYDLLGKYKGSDFTATIVPKVNRLIINYANEHKNEIDAMIKELDEQEKKSLEEQKTNDNSFYK